MDQMEIYWNTASLVACVAAGIISSCLFMWFMRPFLGRSRCAWEAGGAHFIFMRFADAVIITMVYFTDYEARGMLPDAIGLIVVLAVMCLRDWDDQYSHCSGSYEDLHGIGHRKVRNLEQKIFLVVVMYLVEWFTHGIATLFRDILFRAILFSPAILDRPIMVYFGIYVVVEVTYLFLRFWIMLFLFKIINRAYVYKKENISKKELGLLIAVPLSVMVGYISFTFFFDSYLSDMQQYIQDMHMEYNWIKALYQIMSFVAIISSIVLYQSIKESHRREKEEAVLGEQMESLKRHMGEVEALYQNIRGLKHDMGNHVLVLENLCRRGQQQEAIGYLRSIKEEFHEAVEEIKTGNPITDVILMEKEKAARDKGITFFNDFHYPKDTLVNAFDISVILNNAIGNAIEGAVSCEKPYIRILSFQKKNAYLIEVRNNFTGKLLMDQENGVPMTSKENKEEHGCGLANIRKVARKYFGDMEVAQEGDNFILRVMLMLK